jgi:enamine deaminase RidA (YjgF/YER057c/UK114 family)
MPTNPSPDSRRPASPGSRPIPDGWPRGSGYSHAVVAEGRQIYISGQIGWNPVTERLVEGGMAAQTRQALANIATVLAAAGAEPAHLVRLTWFITGREAYLRERRAIGAAYREVFGRHFPAMSVVVVATLLEPGAEVEIEATAVIPTS